MEQIYGLIGIFAVLFAMLASTNGLKKYTKNQIVRWIAKKHRIFGGVAIILAIVHMILVFVDQSFRLTGILAISAIILTGLFGGLFYKVKKKAFYLTHRAFAGLSIILIVIHIILNARF